MLGNSSPQVRSRWTDDGQSHAQRALKQRARNATRDVPIPPALVRLLREHVDAHGSAHDASGRPRAIGC
ncbi:hypothetical protein ACWC5I_14245 [Kitasatospora sp. NPDC001574]